MKKLALLDYTTSDYFSGYHLPVIAIPVFSTLTNKEISEELKREFDYTYELYEEIKEYEVLLNEYCEDLDKDPDIVFVECEDNSEDFEPAYLYFSIIDPVYNNGIMFLS